MKKSNHDVSILYSEGNISKLEVEKLILSGKAIEFITKLSTDRDIKIKWIDDELRKLKIR